MQVADFSETAQVWAYPLSVNLLHQYMEPSDTLVLYDSKEAQVVHK